MNDRNAHDPVLAQTFDLAAELYQRARPDYPAELFDRLIAVAGVRAGDRLLEIGCATGKATLPLAERGFRITCVELGGRLAAAARRNLARFPEVTVVEGRFEEWTNGGGQLFDLVFAATAWYWINPEVRYRKAADVLRPDGHLAFWEAVHVFPENGDPFFEAIQEGPVNTFSGRLAMEEWQRDRLYGEIRRRLAQRPDRRLRRQWGGVLHIARRS